jgi:hypothetical protein
MCSVYEPEVPKSGSAFIYFFTKRIYFGEGQVVAFSRENKDVFARLKNSTE